MAALPQLPAVQETSDDASKDAVFENILETLQENNFLLDEIEENTESDESITEKRNRRIKEEETDPKEKKPGIFSKVGSGLKATGGALQKLNPFSGGIGTKTTILLLAGALFAITKLGPKLVDPLAKFLQWFKEDAMQDITDLWITAKGWWTKTWNNVTEFFNWMRYEFIPDMQDLWVKAKVWWAIQWPKVQKFFDWVKGIFTKIGDYIDSFDKDGIPGLSKDEMKDLQEDLVGKVKDMLMTAFGTLSLITVGLFAVGGIGYAMLKGAAQAATFRLFGGKKPSGGGGGSVRGSAKPKPSIIKTALKSLAVGTQAFTGTSVGATRATAAAVSGATRTTAAAVSGATTTLPKGTRLNSAGRLINIKSGQYVKPFAHLSKYPRLLSAARKIPLLGPVLSGALAYSVMTNDKLSKDEKIVEMGGILGGALGSIGFGIAGAAIGSAFPIVGTVIGGLVGSLGGYFGGEWAGEKLASFLFGKEVEPMSEMMMSSGSKKRSSRGPVEAMSESMMSSGSKKRSSRGSREMGGVNDQYYDGEVPKLSILGEEGMTASKGSSPIHKFQDISQFGPQAFSSKDSDFIIKVLNPDADIRAKGDNRYNFVDSRTITSNKLDNYVGSGLTPSNLDNTSLAFTRGQLL